MAYQIYNSDGTLFATINDGTLNTASSMTLVGKNWAGYGAYLDTNFLHLLQHFSSSNPPSNPVTGQIWWNPTTSVLSAWTGVIWKQFHSSSTGLTAPVNPSIGDLWFDTNTGTLKAWDGAGWVTIGPSFLNGTGMLPTVMIDTLSQPHNVIKMMVNNNVAGIISQDTFIPASPVAGIGTVKPGINMSCDIGGSGNVGGYNGCYVSVTGNITAGGNFIGNGALLSGTGPVVVNDVASAADLWPTFANITTGRLETVFTSQNKLIYNPSTGRVTADTLTSRNDALVNGLTVGRGGGNLTTNTVLGAGALVSNTSGNDNTAIGVSALATVTSGGFNTAVGFKALWQNNADNNTAVGDAAMMTNTSGAMNVAIGSKSLQTNTTGAQNTALGMAALLQNTSGSFNTALGCYSMYRNTTGIFNVAIGQNSLSYNTTGYENIALGWAMNGTGATACFESVAVGSQTQDGSPGGFRNTSVGHRSLKFNSNGTGAVAVGWSALMGSTNAEQCTAVGAATMMSASAVQAVTAIGTQSCLNVAGCNDLTAVGSYTLMQKSGGAPSTAVGSYALQSESGVGRDTAVGYEALRQCTTGWENTAVGHLSLRNVTNAFQCTAVGAYSFYSITTGVHNVAIGATTAYLMTSGSDNTLIGHGAGNNLLSADYNTMCGAYAGGAMTTGQHNTFLGHASGQDGMITITNQSNRLVLGSGNTSFAYVNVPITVVSDKRDKNLKGDVPLGLAFVNKLKPVKFTFKKSRKDDSDHGPMRYGFFAQDILAAEKEATGENVIIDTEFEEKLKYNDTYMTPVLVNAINELTEMLNGALAKIEALEAQLAKKTK